MGILTGLIGTEERRSGESSGGKRTAEVIGVNGMGMDAEDEGV